MIENQIFIEIPSVLGLPETILTPRFETHDWGINIDTEDECYKFIMIC